MLNRPFFFVSQCHCHAESIQHKYFASHTSIHSDHSVQKRRIELTIIISKEPFIHNRPIFCMRIHQHAVMPPHPAFKPSVPPPNAADTTCLQLKPPFQYVELLRNREHFIVMKRSFFSTFNMCVNNKWMAVQKKKEILLRKSKFSFSQLSTQADKIHLEELNTQKFLHSGFVVVAKRNCRFSVEMGNSHFEDESIKTVAWLCLEKKI